MNDKQIYQLLKSKQTAISMGMLCSIMMKSRLHKVYYTDYVTKTMIVWGGNGYVLEADCVNGRNITRIGHWAGGTKTNNPNITAQADARWFGSHNAGQFRAVAYA